jgi:hypothetical protein
VTRLLSKAAFALGLFFPSFSAPAQEVADTLLFNDGDKLTGEFRRIERGTVYFYMSKTGELSLQPNDIGDLKVIRPFAIFLKDAKRRKEDALVGTIEIRGGELFLHAEGKPEQKIETSDITYAMSNALFIAETSKRQPLHRGWNAQVGAGITIVRSTDKGLTFNTDFSASRTVPDITFLPDRNRTSVSVTDSYEKVTSPSYYEQGAFTENETHIFHANLERNDYFTTRFYVLGTYSFDRNFSQGLLAQHSYGGGIGWTLYKSFSNQFDLKTNYDRRTQEFNDLSYNTHLNGQKFAESLRYRLPLNMDIEQDADFEASYNKPEDYAANLTARLNIPVYRSLGVSITATDNFLNNAQPGADKNSYRFVTSLSYYFR